MKKIAMLFFMLIALSGLVNAFGFYNDKGMYDTMGFRGLGFFMGVGLLALIFGALILFFWIMMLIDCLKRDFKKDVEKIVWILVLIFLHLLGAIIYYFVVKVADKQAVRAKKK